MCGQALRGAIARCNGISPLVTILDDGTDQAHKHAADALARQYPQALFFTMVRELAPRARSAINFYFIVHLVYANNRTIFIRVATLTQISCQRNDF